MTENPVRSRHEDDTMGDLVPFRAPAPDPQPPADLAKTAPSPAGAPVLEGTVYQNGVKILPPDPVGDMPWLPAWATTPEGRRAYRTYLRRRTRRSARRWAGQQRTPRGHAAQIRRGIRRTHAWVMGVEGIQVRAAHQKAQDSGRTYESAARKARDTPGMLKTRKEKAQKLADAAQTKAISDMNAYTRAKKDLSTLRWVRGSFAYGPVAGAVAAGTVIADTPGMITAILAALASFACAGRRLEADIDWTQERQQINDGDSLTEPFTHHALIQARVYTEDKHLVPLGPPQLNADCTAWEFDFDLPAGITIDTLINRIDEFAGALGCETAQIHLRKSDREGRINLYVCKTLPFTGKPKPGPLVRQDTPTQFLGDIPWGVAVRGNLVSVCLLERTILLGGMPGSGKTSGADSILLYAALDPRVSLWLSDAKNGTGIQHYEKLADEYLAGPHAAKFIQLLEKLVSEMRSRFDFLTSIGEEKVTPQLAEEYDELRPLLFHCDEILHYVIEREYKTKVDDLLIRLITQARAAGIIIVIATQKPSSDVINTSWRDLLWGAAAYHCKTWQMSDTILGGGVAKTGANAQSIARTMRGVHWLAAEEEEPIMVHSHYYGPDHRLKIIERAYEWRREAGTLPDRAFPLTDRVAQCGDDGKTLSAVLALYDDHATGDHPAQWLPSSVITEALLKAGTPVTDTRLGHLVPRQPDEKGKRPWNGTGPVAGYPQEAVKRAALEMIKSAS